MRRILAVLFVMATIVVVPAVPATAHEHRVEVTVVAEEVPVGVTDDGATLTAGPYTVLFEGMVVGAGTVYGTYYERETGVHGTRHFVDGTTGEEVYTDVKAFIVDVDDSGDPVIVSYVFEENITAHSEGTTGHGQGSAVLTAFSDGSFVLETTLYAILEFAE